MVAADFQHDGEALLVHEGSPVKTLSDLDGRSVIAPPSMTWIPYVQKKYGIKFDLRPLNYGIAVFLSDKDAIQQCMMTSEPFFARQHGAKVRTIRIAGSGYDPYHTLMCRRELVRNEPEVVRAFVAASIRGWHDFLEGDPAPAFDAIQQRNRQMSREQLEFSRQAVMANALVTGDPARGERIGDLAIERIQHQIDALVEFKIIDRPVNVAEVATRAFLPKATKP
jgi:NitT/TauT family transport system substrate-binding protein